MNQSPANAQNVHDSVQHSKPISISTHHLRHRSASFSSELSNSPPSPPLVTPGFPPTRMSASSGSPILYFLSQSPSKAPSTFPFRGFPPPLLEDESGEEAPLPAHARRASTTSRFQPPPIVPEPHHERGVNVLRRLSLSGHRGKSPVADIPMPGMPGIPQSPPRSAPLSSFPTSDMRPSHKPRRSATITGQTRPHRAPSPMGERILKGHFDGFN